MCSNYTFFPIVNMRHYWMNHKLGIRYIFMWLCFYVVNFICLCSLYCCNIFELCLFNRLIECSWIDWAFYNLMLCSWFSWSYGFFIWMVTLDLSKSSIIFLSKPSLLQAIPVKSSIKTAFTIHGLKLLLYIRYLPVFAYSLLAFSSAWLKVINFLYVQLQFSFPSIDGRNFSFIDWW